MLKVNLKPIYSHSGTEICTHVQWPKSALTISDRNPHSRKILGTEIFTHDQGPKYPIHAKFSGTEILTHDQGPKYPIHAGTEIPTHDQGPKYRIPFWEPSKISERSDSSLKCYFFA